MKNQLSVNAAVYAHENSCLEDILAIADEMKLKAQLTHKSTKSLRRVDSESSGERVHTRAKIQQGFR